MKKLRYSIIALLAVLAFGFTACEEDQTANISEVTYFPSFELQGENPYLIDAGNPPASYEDPGVTVTEEGEEIEYDISHNVDVNTKGFYTVTYSATNKDGYSAQETRTVIVGCPGDLDKTLTVTGEAESSLGFTYEVSVERADNGKFKFNEITGAFNVAIQSEIGIVCDEVVTGSSSYGMYDSATLDLENNQLVITWSYPPLGYSGVTTTIPVTYN